MNVWPWIGFIWHRIGTDGGLVLKLRGSIKCGNFITSQTLRCAELIELRRYRTEVQTVVYC